jgi:hypothetical protein
MFFWMFFMARPKNTEKIMTGRMQPMITKVSCHDKMKTKIKATMMNKKDRMNMDTLVERPSYTTVMSAPRRLTKESSLLNIHTQVPSFSRIEKFHIFVNDG